VAFDEAKETVGSYVLDALTPLISGFVDKGIPAITDFARNLGQTLGPAFEEIFKIIRDDLLPILTKWWGFLYNEIIPAIGSVVGPILQGLKSAFDSIRSAIKNNSAELQPFYDFLELIWKFIKNNLAPLLGGAFKTALEVIGDIVGGLVTGFSRLVGFINSTITAITKFVNFVRDNPVTRFFFGDDNSKGLKAGGVLDDTKSPVVPPTFFPTGPTGPTGPPVIVTSKGLGTRDISGLSLQQQAAVLRSIELQAETDRLRQARESAAAARLVETGGLSTAERITINVNAPTVIDQEGFSRAVTDALNNSFYRGTLGAGALAI
jgi:hypothetical protein